MIWRSGSENVFEVDVDVEMNVDVDVGHREGIAGSGDHQMVARPRTPTPSMAENYSQKHNESDSGTT